MVIQHNLTAMNSNRQLTITTGLRAKSSEKLSSGYKINRAADDAAGLSISEKMRRQIRGLDQGSENLQDGISMLQTAEGALQEAHDMLQRISELTIKASNDTLEYSDKVAIQQEINQIKLELNRIGSSTTFNDRHILGDIYPEGRVNKKLSDIIKSSAAESGSLSEAYQKDGRWYPAASMDFSEVDRDVIEKLDGKGFTFTCAANCDEKFEFYFDTTSSDCKIEGSTSYGSGTHKYIIGVADCNNGYDMVEKIFDFAYKNPLVNAPAPESKNSIHVSHTNTIERTSSSKFVLWGSVGAYPTEEQAKHHKFSPGMGKVDCSGISGEIDIEKRDLWIQAGPDRGNGIKVVINRMDSTVLDIDDIDVTYPIGAKKAIDKVKGAIQTVSEHRALLGAQQNRLEHSYANNRNIEENTTAAESRIRDTDMATEMVKYSNDNILAQAGQSMLAQANQTNQGVLSLLQ